MAPPINRRSKQGSLPSSPPNSLPGIAIGVLAAVAAGFAARCALRRKSSLRSKNDEDHAGIPPPVMHDREIGINGKNDLECTTDGTIAGPCNYPKVVADIEILVDAKKIGLLWQKGRAGEEEVQEDKEEEDALDVQASGKSMNAEGDVKKEEAGEEESIDVDGEISENISVKVKAALTLDGLSIKALQSVALAISEEAQEEENFITIVEEQDTGEDGDDDRSSAGQPPSPVLINGRIFEFFDELSDLKDEPELSTSGGNSFSDSLSECSMQEVSSAPVKPLVLADETLETSWVAKKPHFVGALDQVGQEVVEVEGKKWSDVKKANKDRKVPEMEETFSHQVYKEGFDSNEGFSDSSHELDVDEKPLQTANSVIDFSNCEINKVNVEILSDNFVALEGEVSEKLTGEETESARINGKVLSYSRSLGECNDLNPTSSEQAAQELNESANDVVSTTLQKEPVTESACMNGKVVCDESSNDPCRFVDFPPDDCPSLESAQQGACHAVFEINDEMKYQSTKGRPLNASHAIVEVQDLVESVRDVSGLGTIAQASRGDHFHGENILLPDMPDLKSVRLAFSKEAMVVSTRNLLVGIKGEPAEELTYKKACLESIEEPAMQSSGHDVPIVDSIENDIPDATHGMACWKDHLEYSIDSLVADMVDSTQGMPSLERGFLERLHAEKPAVQAGGDDTISEFIKDSIQNAANDTAFLRNTTETNLEGMEEFSIDNPVLNSEALRNVPLTPKLPSVEGSPLEESIGEEPGMHSGGQGITTSAVVANDNAENVGTAKEQPASFLAPLEDSREDYELSPKARADEVENCSTSRSGRKEDKLADSGMACSSTDTKQQEIEEIFNVDATDDSKETACRISSQHTSCGNTREIDQVFTKGAVGLQSRSTFSSIVLRYLPVEIALICSLIAFVSFFLQYLKGSISNEHCKYATSE